MGRNNAMAAKKFFSEEQKECFVSRYEAGESCSSIALDLSVQPHTISRIIKKIGIKLRSASDVSKAVWKIPSTLSKFQNSRRGLKPPAAGKRWKLMHRRIAPHMIGELNHQWKGGTTKLSFLIRSLPEYAMWRMQVFQRDRWTCQICKKKNRVGVKLVLDADHIYPLSRIIEERKIKSVPEALSCERIWDIKNGRCLCRECHRETDTWGPNITPGRATARTRMEGSTATGEHRACPQVVPLNCVD